MGLSPPPVPSRALCSSPPANSNPSPSNNSSIAIKLTKAATVVLWTTLSNTSRPTHSSSSPTTLTLVETDHALTPNPRVLLRLLVSKMLLPDPAPNSTTVSSLLVTVPSPVPTTSSSRTPGVPHGVLTVMSRWPHPNVVLPTLPLDQLNDL